jgi:hypothetical protein
VKVYSAAVTADPSVGRMGTCAVIAPDQVQAWLAALPPSRALTPDRTIELVEAVRSLI